MNNELMFEPMPNSITTDDGLTSSQTCTKPTVIGSQLHRFPYRWNLKDAVFTKDKGKVFSCFACGGGSTMGYKLAGFDVIGCNEIDPKMIEAYKANHNPKYAFLEPIQTFKDRQDLPDELYHLDILDGSPPCSSFSMAGNREKDWGKEKVFREGQVEQVLDTLFFDFIELAKKLQPKVVIAENVKGLLMGNAKHYYRKVHKELAAAGYSVTAVLADGSKMGVPQKRERVFVIGVRLDIAEKLNFANIYVPEINLKFNELEIPFKEINDFEDSSIEQKKAGRVELWGKCKPGEQFSKYHPKGHYFADYKLKYTDIVPTITASVGDGAWHPDYCRLLNRKELCCAGTYPQDYNFQDNGEQYLIGMSVPPIMTAQIASEVFSQWLSKLG
jgi:DNA (cytosine-5)-methyltransferase 1